MHCICKISAQIWDVANLNMYFPALSDDIHAILSLAFIQDRVQRERTMRLPQLYSSVADISAQNSVNRRECFSLSRLVKFIHGLPTSVPRSEDAASRLGLVHVHRVQPRLHVAAPLPLQHVRRQIRAYVLERLE